MTRSPLHTIHLSAYVDLALDDVLDAFASWSDIDDLLTAAVARAVGDRGPVVAVRSGEPTRVSDGHAFVNVSWRVPTPRGETAEARAEVAMLRVQSGRLPLTELLLAVDVAVPAVPRVAPVLRRVLDEVTERLALRPAGGPMR
jgi:hypothetical protein